MDELVFNVTPAEEGGYCAMAVGEGIATQGDTWDELCDMVVDATEGYFFDLKPPLQIRLEPSGQILHPRQAA
jgi:predicted RNase H-like HicB family nuclease